MKTKYILVEWPESQHFIGVEGCHYVSLNEDDDLSMDQAMFVPEEIYRETFNQTTNSEYVSSKLSDVRELIRQSLSKILMDTSEDNPLECHIVLEHPEDQGLSSLLLPTVRKIWQHPTEGWVTCEFIGRYTKDFDNLEVEELLQILKGLEDENSNTRTSN